MTVAWGVGASDEVRQRRVEMLTLLSLGCTTQQMAQQLHLSERTVKNHLHDMLVAMGARNRAHAVAIAYRWGLLRTSEEYPPATPEMVVGIVAEALQVDLRALAATR